MGHNIYNVLFAKQHQGIVFHEQILLYCLIYEIYYMCFVSILHILYLLYIILCSYYIPLLTQKRGEYNITSFSKIEFTAPHLLVAEHLNFALLIVYAKQKKMSTKK